MYYAPAHGLGQWRSKSLFRCIETCEDQGMKESEPRTASTRWVIQHEVLLFYGNGGLFQGDAVTRWYAALQAAEDLRLVVVGAGPVFSFDPGVRAQGTELFKGRKLPLAVLTENPMQRMLGLTARLRGTDLQIYSWSESVRPFQQLGVGRAIIEQLNDTLKRLRRDIDQELRMLGPE
jgi:hypothetical protein